MDSLPFAQIWINGSFAFDIEWNPNENHAIIDQDEEEDYIVPGHMTMKSFIRSAVGARKPRFEYIRVFPEHHPSYCDNNYDDFLKKTLKEVRDRLGCFQFNLLFDNYEDDEE